MAAICEVVTADRVLWMVAWMECMARSNLSQRVIEWDGSSW